MKYYVIKVKSNFNEEDRILGRANGENVPNGKYFFEQMGKGEIIKDAPIFDYFHLESFDKREYWEWRLQDVHEYIGVGSIISGWYISDDFKILLDNFIIASQYYFYETRLLFKREKLKYWIFQFPIEPLKNIDFQESTFVLDGDEKIYSFLSVADYLTFYRHEYKSTRRKLRIQC